MKIAILILSADKEPGISNIEGIKNTYVSLANKLQSDKMLKNTYDFYFYYGDKNENEKYSKEYDIKIEKLDNDSVCCYSIWTKLGENIYNTFEKSIIAFNAVVNKYDFYVRTNISCYINIPVLDKFISIFKNNILYCNAINTYINDEKYNNNIYPRGDLMIFSNNIMRGIIDNSEKYWRCDEALIDRICIPHVDDCLIGLCLIDFFGKKEYVNHLEMIKYNFIPTCNDITLNDWSAWCIGSRVKTIPPGIGYSGYSWEDNEYRRRDIYKMNALNNVISELAYKSYDKYNISKNDINRIITSERPTLAVELTSIDISTIKNYIKNKREE